ncbi:MAG: aspartate-semialdehyde dehydrogenase [Candidatus Micrarchaeia archaeon]
MDRRKAAVVGATGVAGQQFLACLANHPQFEVVKLAASERSAGKKYKDAITDPSGSLKWFCNEPLAEEYASMVVEDAAKMSTRGLDIVFTAVESDTAKVLEPQYAKDVPVVSTASAFRYEPDVPIFIPAVNMEHAKLIEVQKKRRGWKGFITPVPNCTTTGLAMSLAPIHNNFGVKRCLMTSSQAVSGAGRSPGVLALDIIDNLIPYIPKEEEKVETETRKILGKLSGDEIKPAAFPVSATCTRVAVLDGHFECVFVELERKASVEDAKKAFREFGKEFLKLGLHSAPKELIVVTDDPYRPQPRLDRETNGGMSVTVGRIRQDNALQNGLKWVLVSHNTKLGAAKGGLLVAEYLAKQGYL